MKHLSRQVGIRIDGDVIPASSGIQKNDKYRFLLSQE